MRNCLVADYPGSAALRNHSVAGYAVGDVSVPDTIEREVLLPAAVTRVWAAITEAEQLAAWFGQRASIDLRPGGAVTFTWDRSDGGTHINRGTIEVVEPLRRFAFRWRSGADDEPMTRVEFTLEQHPQGTRLRVVESGFASLPPERRAERRRENVDGWRLELAELEALTSGSASASA
jgi:uncharacterized protein YndB with AHSA1/START domain